MKEVNLKSCLLYDSYYMSGKGKVMETIKRSVLPTGSEVEVNWWSLGDNIITFQDAVMMIHIIYIYVKFHRTENRVSSDINYGLQLTTIYKYQLTNCNKATIWVPDIHNMGNEGDLRVHQIMPCAFCSIFL